MIIKFTNTTKDVDILEPKPASMFLPDWYKNTESYINGEKKPLGDGITSGTIKRCMPVFDAMTAGYIITSLADVFVSQKEGLPWFEWADLGLISFHPIEQAPEHPAKNGFNYPKWMNYWAIKTPKGYSTLFIPPVHRESVFTIFEGIVDTDVYTSPVNFPFTLNDPNFQGLIPAGTPIAQVIPFKRESWTMKFGNKKDLEQQAKVNIHLSRYIFDRYKNLFWLKKQYK
jgi:hypothetical protein